MKFGLIRFVLLVVLTQAYAARKRGKPRFPGVPVLATLWPSYDAIFRPGELEQGPATRVNFSLIIDDIVHVKEGTMQAAVTFLAIVKLSWLDPRLAWSKEDLPVTKLHVPITKLWTPNIRLLRNLDPKMELDARYTATVLSTGVVYAEVPTHLFVHCGRPRDSRANWECLLRFSSWAYDDDEVDLRLVGEKRAEMPHYHYRVWLIAGNAAWEGESSREGYKEIDYSIKILRR